jgi:hypothetical protein
MQTHLPLLLVVGTEQVFRQPEQCAREKETEKSNHNICPE